MTELKELKDQNLSKEFKILIIGQGVIGTIYGSAFAYAGNTQVFHYLRKGKHYTKHIKMDVLDERPKNYKMHNGFVYIPQVIKDPTAQNFDFILVPVPSNKLIAALKELALIKGTFIIMSLIWESQLI